ncbi:MAG: hypothetical protein D6820_12855, partial [Lentisphaerae bacterium]
MQYGSAVHEEVLTIKFILLVMVGFGIVMGRGRSGERPVPLRPRDYTFGWWVDGFHKADSSRQSDWFCVETGHYVFALDVKNLEHAKFRRRHGEGYLQDVTTGTAAFKKAAETDFRIEVEHGGRLYRARRCLAGRSGNLCDVYLRESARFVQRYWFPGLEFYDGNGKMLKSESMLEV